jgi:hypothetical protein
MPCDKMTLGRLMKFRYRIMVFAFGGFILARGWTRYIDFGVFPVLNGKMQPVYPIGIVIIGIVCMAMAFLPNRLKIERDPKSPRVLRIRKFR